MNKKVSDQRFYIAYGSNLHTGQMSRRCPEANVVCKGELKDHELVFQGRRGNAHANVIPAEGKSVPVVVWAITENDEASLDIYEGVRGGYYRKEQAVVETETGQQIEGLIYIMEPNGYNMPSPYYFDIIAVGYEDFGFDADVLYDAFYFSRQRMMEGAKARCVRSK